MARRSAVEFLLQSFAGPLIECLFFVHGLRSIRQRRSALSVAGYSFGSSTAKSTTKSTGSLMSETVYTSPLSSCSNVGFISVEPPTFALLVE